MNPREQLALGVGCSFAYWRHDATCLEQQGWCGGDGPNVVEGDDDAGTSDHCRAECFPTWTD